MLTSLLASGKAEITLPVELAFEGEVESKPTSSFVDGQSVSSSGERAGQAYRVRIRAVRVYRVLANGRRRILEFHWGKTSSAIQNGDRHRSTAEAIGVTGIKRMSLKKDPHIWQACCRWHWKTLVRAGALTGYGRQRAIERVAAFLLEMWKRGQFANASSRSCRLPRTDERNGFAFAYKKRYYRNAWPSRHRDFRILRTLGSMHLVIVQ